MTTRQNRTGKRVKRNTLNVIKKEWNEFFFFNLTRFDKVCFGLGFSAS